MLYTNYKQIAEIVLNSQDAEIVESEEDVMLNFAKRGDYIMDTSGTFIRNDGTLTLTSVSEVIAVDSNTVTVTDSTAIEVPQFIVINNEILYVQSKENNVLTVSRAQYGTIAQSHNVGSVVSLYDRRLKQIYDFDLFYNFNKKYRFKIDLINQMSPNVRMAVKSFVFHKGSLLKGWTYKSYDNDDREIGDIYIDNLYDKNGFHSNSNIRNKFHLLSYPICYQNVEEYVNHDILNTSKSIQCTAFQNNYFDIVVDTKIKDINGRKINGCPAVSNWSMTLILYDTVMEENPKNFSNGKLPIMPPRY
jgi:hypothetical protein